MEAIIFVGIQAAGKSTFYSEEFSKTHLRINLDMLRTRNRERQFLETCLRTGQRFVVDNTNPTPEDRKRYIDPSKENGFKVTGYFFQSRISEALERNAHRENSVPELAIRGTHGKLVIPKPDEGFDDLYFVRITGPQGFKVERWRSEV